MSGFFVGFFSGALSSAFVAYCMELGTRRRLHGAAKRLKGEWIAHNMLDGGTVDRSKPMEHTWATVLTPKPWWLSCAANSHVLDISGDHVSTDGRLRHMEGYLTIDRGSPRLATRIVCYTDSDEVSVQRIVISGETLHVFPIVPQSKPFISYDRHALCRRPKVSPRGLK